MYHYAHTDPTPKLGEANNPLCVKLYANKRSTKMQFGLLHCLRLPNDTAQCLLLLSKAVSSSSSVYGGCLLS